MSTWVIWFITWVFLGFLLFASVRKAARKHYSFTPSSHAMFAWILFSAGAAEVTRYYLTIAPFPPLVWLTAGVGVATVGAAAGLVTGWFIGGRSFGRAADILAGIAGASIAGWAEITCSYNHFDCAAAVILFGAIFATLALRLNVRPKTPFEKSDSILM